MDPFFHTGLSISDSLKTVRKSVLIYETIIKLQIQEWIYGSYEYDGIRFLIYIYCIYFGLGIRKQLHRNMHRLIFVISNVYTIKEYSSKIQPYMMYDIANINSKKIFGWWSK